MLAFVILSSSIKAASPNVSSDLKDYSGGFTCFGPLTTNYGLFITVDLFAKRIITYRLFFKINYLPDSH